MQPMLTQPERVLAALRRAPNGLTRVDFQPPNVIDGGEPILNFPGRIKDLRDAGYEIESVGRRSKCLIFKLPGAPGDQSTDGSRVSTARSAAVDIPGRGRPDLPTGAPTPVAVPEPATLFDESSMYDRYGDAA